MSGGNFVRLLEAVIGRRRMWRVGRRLYQHARREGPNDPSTNGEHDLVRATCRLAARQRRGLIALDVGANRGAWTRLLIAEARAAGLQNCHLYAFEPAPTVLSDLQAAVLSAGESVKAEVVPCAVSDEPGRAPFILSDPLGGTHHLASEAQNASGGLLYVDVVTLDSFAKERCLGFIDIVKVDCEGYDPKVLMGATDLLSAGRCAVLQFEYNCRWVDTGHYLKEIFALAARHDLLLGKVVPKGIEFFEDWHPELERFIETNFVLTKPELASSLGAHYGTFDEKNTYA